MAVALQLELVQTLHPGLLLAPAGPDLVPEGADLELPSDDRGLVGTEALEVPLCT